MLTALTVENIRAIIIVIISLFVAIRAFYLYVQAQSPRLFILSLAMVMMSLTTITDTIGNDLPALHLNTYWFNYIGQDAGYTFIFLSLVRSSDKYLRSLIRWQIIIFPLLLIILLIGPTLPSSFPSLGTFRAILSGSRAVVPFLIFFYYYFAFIAKETRFSLLMCGAFLLLTLCYLINAPRYVVPHLDSAQITGDIVRTFGYATLLLALLLG